MINGIMTADEFKYKIDFPKLMWYKYENRNPNVIAMVNEDGTGTIVFSTEKHFPMGSKIQDGLNTNYWKDYLGKVVLYNVVQNLVLNQDKFNEV
jgi:hypothetical protein